jgi:GH15 family glucan-1,4-alpha-glucosidase
VGDNVPQPVYSLIGDYALLSDCRSAALVSRDGSIDWCCFDRLDARPVFERLLGDANNVGLMAEEVDPVSGELLGNFPQAFSQMGLMNSAIQLQRS